MKNIIAYVSLLLVLISCSPNQDKNTVTLFNNITYKLNKGEKIVQLDINKKNIFSSYIKNDRSTQIPLFKCIEADNYLTFIGIPFNTSIKKISEINLNKDLEQTQSESDSLTYTFKKYKSNNEYISTYAKNFDENLIYIFTVANSSKISDSLFNKKSFSNRLLISQP